MTPEQAAALRAPFPPEAIGKLPKAGIKLDYVGHAGVTDRLLAVDPAWTWEPAAVNEFGVPLITAGGLWIKLTVCGVTRYGFGDGPDIKQMIGDAIRNAAMRFGVALDLWSKEDLHAIQENAEGKESAAGNATHDVQGGGIRSGGAMTNESRPSATSSAGSPESTRPAANGSESPSRAPSPSLIVKLKARATALVASNVDIGALRKQWQLPEIGSSSEKQLDLWDELLTDEEKKLTAPFAEATS